MRYNYIKYGWGNKLYGKRENLDKMWVKFDPCTLKPMSWREECIRAVDMMYQSTDKQMLVHFSGGIDSEIICRALLENNHPFKVSIGRFENGLNSHDIAYAVKFCKEYNIEYSFIDFDMIDFINTNFYHYRDVKFPNPLWQTCMHKYFLDKGYGYQIMGEGHLYLSHDLLNIKKQYYKDPYHFPAAAIRPYTWPKDRRLDDDVYLLVYENAIEVDSYMSEHEIDGCYLFHMFTPELAYSYVTDPIVLDWLTYCQLTGDELPEDRLYPFDLKSLTKEEYRNIGYKFGGNNILNIKLNIKYREWPELEVRPKWSGMENIDQRLLIDLTDRVSKEQPWDSPGNEVVTMTYDELIRDLEGDLSK